MKSPCRKIYLILASNWAHSKFSNPVVTMDPIYRDNPIIYSWFPIQIINQEQFSSFNYTDLLLTKIKNNKSMSHVYVRTVNFLMTDLKRRIYVKINSNLHRLTEVIRKKYQSDLKKFVLIFFNEGKYKKIMSDVFGKSDPQSFII